MMGVKRSAKRAVWFRDGGRCFWCDRLVQKWGERRRIPVATDAATIDHIVPISCGGSSRQDNLVLACFGCNSERGITPADVFLRSRRTPSSGIGGVDGR